MEIPIRRVDRELPLPEYKTEGAAALDCVVRETTVVPSKGIAYAPLNIAVSLPSGHFGMLVARSSLHKRGLMMPNSIGIFDEDYAGNADEYKAVLYNFTDAEVTVERGERIVQLLILPFDRVQWQEVDDLGRPDRGAFGTTGY